MGEAPSRDNARPGGRRVAADVVWHAAVAVWAWWCGYAMVQASDLWWHIANGRLILESRSIPLRDTWSFTAAGHPWLQHEWLAGLLFAAWSSAFGVSTLVYWKWLTLAAVFVLLFRSLRATGADPVSRFLAVAFCAATAANFLDIRPHLLSLLGFAALLASDLPRRQTPLWLPALFIIWANVHGGFVFGLLALAVLTIPALVDPARRRRSALGLVACVAACAANPTGVKAFAYPFRYAFDRTSPYRMLIGEWAPPWRSGGIVAPLYPVAIAALALAVVVLVASRRRRPLDALAITSMALAALTLAMSMTSRRFIPLFALGAAAPIATASARLFGPWLLRLPALLAPGLALALGLWLVHPYPAAPDAFHYVAGEFEFPVDTCDFIEANALEGDVFALWNWGGYLHYRTGGRMKVFADGRADTVFDDATLLKYATVQYRREGWRDIVERSPAGYVLWPRDEYPSVASELLASGGWRIVHVDAVSILLARSSATLAELRPAPPSAWSDLADGSLALQKGDHASAEAAFRAALSRLPWLRPACYGLADSQAGRGAARDAQETFDRCQRTFPEPRKKRP